MPTTSLVPTSIISATGWTGATVANLSSSDDTRATDGVAGELISCEITNSPGDFGSQNSIQLHIEARTQGTVQRPKTLLVELLDSGDNVLQSFTTDTLTGTDSTHNSTAFTRTDSSTVIDGYRIRCTVQEGGGMPDTATVEIDRVWATLDYNVAAIQGTTEFTGTGSAATVARHVATMAASGAGSLTTAATLIGTINETTLFSASGSLATTARLVATTAFSGAGSLATTAALAGSITLGASATRFSTNSTGQQFESNSITPQDTTGNLIVALIGMQEASVSDQVTLDSITFGTASRSFGTGTAMTVQVLNSRAAGNAISFVLATLADVSSAGTVQIDTAVNLDSIIIDVFELKNVDGTTPVPEATSLVDNTTDGGSISLTTDSTNAWIIGGAAMRATATSSSVSDGTQLNEGATGTSEFTDVRFVTGYKEVASPGSASLGFTWNTSVENVLAIIEVKPGAFSSAIQRTTTLSASGSMSTAARLVATTAATGSGDISTVARLSAATALDGSGTLSTTARHVATTQASGAGSLATVATLTVQGTTAAAGVGTMSTAARLIGTAAHSGTGSVTSAAVFSAAAVHSGTATLTTAASLQATTAFAGVGSLTTVASGAINGTTDFSATGAMSSAARLMAAATFTSSGTASTAARLVAAATYTSAGSISTVARLMALAAFNGSADLASAAQFAANTTSTGAGSLASVARLVAVTAFDGVGSLDTAAILSGGLLSRSSVFSGVGALSGSARFIAVSAFAGAGDASTTARFPVAVAFSASGDLSTLARLSGASVFGGAGSLSSLALFRSTTAYTGVGSLSTAGVVSGGVVLPVPDVRTASPALETRIVTPDLDARSATPAAQSRSVSVPAIGRAA